MLVAHYEYDPSGNDITPSGHALSFHDSFPHRFSSKYFDQETGLSYYGERFYNSLTGRWLSRDPIAENGGLNLYGYVGNNPINAVDPLGQEAAVLNYGGETGHSAFAVRDNGNWHIYHKYAKSHYLAQGTLKDVQSVLLVGGGYIFKDSMEPRTLTEYVEYQKTMNKVTYQVVRYELGDPAFDSAFRKLMDQYLGDGQNYSVAFRYGCHEFSDDAMDVYEDSRAKSGLQRRNLSTGGWQRFWDSVWSVF